MRRLSLPVLCALPLHALAADVVVRIGGVTRATGEIGCALFDADKGFPMDNASARALWQPATPDGVICRFADVAAGRYAVSVAYDLNGNRRVDTNVIGLPTEAWGVSNGVRPTLRAPRFDEAAFTVPGGDVETVLDITLAR